MDFSLKTPVFRFILILLLFTSINSHADSSDSVKQSILDHPGFESFKKTLSLIINDRAQNIKGTHHFYIARYEKGSNISYMLWKEGRKLWIRDMGGGYEDSWLAMRMSTGGQFLDVDKDVVETQEEVGSSTYLVTRTWMNQKIYDAVIDGDLVTVQQK